MIKGNKWFLYKEILDKWLILEKKTTSECILKTMASMKRMDGN